MGAESVFLKIQSKRLHKQRIPSFPIFQFPSSLESCLFTGNLRFAFLLPFSAIKYCIPSSLCFPSDNAAHREKEEGGGGREREREVMGSASNPATQTSYDLSFKILLIGDSAVGKSSLLLSFISNSVEDLAPTIGVDFKIKSLKVGGKRLKLTIWDTAGQEKFRTLTNSYYRGAQGIILVYDVTRRETFTNLCDVWAKEVDVYSTNQDCVKMLVGNKVDIESERIVSREEGIALAKELGSLFLECSAKTRENVEQCFEELALKIMEVPSLLEEGSNVGKRNILKQKQEQRPPPQGGCCS